MDINEISKTIKAAKTKADNRDLSKITKLKHLLMEALTEDNRQEQANG